MIDTNGIVSFTVMTGDPTINRGKTVHQKLVDHKALRHTCAEQMCTCILQSTVFTVQDRRHPIVLAGQRFKKNPLEDGPTDAYLGRSENGWMNSEVFYEYVANSFLPWVKLHNTPKPILLLVDGHSSHVTYQVGKLCKLYPLPAHASHIIQPSEVSMG